MGPDLCSASLNILQTRLRCSRLVSLTHLFLLSLKQLGLALLIGHLEGIIPLLQQQVALLQVPAQSPESRVTEQENHFHSSNCRQEPQWSEAVTHLWFCSMSSLILWFCSSMRELFSKTSFFKHSFSCQ